MVIYNVTFMVAEEIRSEYLEWMRTRGLGELVNAESPARSPRLTELVEVPGDPEFSKQACSFAFQVELTDLDVAHKWAETYLAPVVGEFTEKFGQEKALVFTTILNELPL